MVKVEELKKKRLIIFMFLSCIAAFLLMSGGSYAYFLTTVKSKEFVIYTGSLAVDYTKKTNVISLNNLYPMTDKQGLDLAAHQFEVKNNGNIDARYQVRLELDNSSKNMIPIEYIKLSYSLDGSSYSTPVLLSNLDSSLTFLRNQILTPTSSNSISIKMWIDLSAPNEIQGKEFKARIVVDSIQNVEDGYVVDAIPIIYLNKDSNGNQDINLKTGQTYIELGVNRVADDQEIFTTDQVKLSYEYYNGTNLTTVNNINTNNKGIYYITYNITDKNGNVGKAFRVVTVNDSDTIPSISLNGNSSITLGENDNYKEHGVTVDSKNKVAIIGEVKTSKVGTYLVRYIVVDSNGNLNSVVRTVNVTEVATLYNKIFAYNNLIEVEPTLTNSSDNTSDASGLYKSIKTNSGDPTYYFRGNVENNYVDFAGFIWRIVRINEDGTIRLVMQDGINDNAAYSFNTVSANKDNMYYSNSDSAKPTLEAWYSSKIASNTNYSNLVSTGEYYCEQAKIAYDSTYALNSGADMIVYSDYQNPNFICNDDSNGYGLVSASVGLLSYDEVLHAGGYYGKSNKTYYLYDSARNWWTIGPAGFDNSEANIWFVDTVGGAHKHIVSKSSRLRPVINLKTDTVVTGLGTSDKPYKVQ